MATKQLDSDKDTENASEYQVKNSDDGLLDAYDDANLMGIVSELEADNGAYVSVYRASTGRSKGPYIFRCFPSEFSLPDILDKLRDEYGGGEFRLVLSRNGAMVKNWPVNVEKPRLMPQRHDDKPAQPTPGGSELAAVLMQMQASSQQQSDSMRDFMMQQSEKTSAMMLEIVRATSGSKSDQPPITMTDMLQTMLALKELGGEKPVNDTGGSAKELLDMYFKGMEQGKELSGNAPDDSILQTAIKAFGPSIGEITSKLSNMETKPQLPTRRAPLPKTIPGAVPGTVPVSVPAQPVEEEPMLNDFLKATQAMQQFSPYINMLVNAAKQNSDVEVYANLILDQLDEDTIAEWIINPDNYKKVMAYLPPEINANPEHVSWFDDLRMVVIALLTEESDDEASDVLGDGEHEAAIPDKRGPEFAEESK